MARRTTDAEIRAWIKLGKRRAYKVDDNLYLNVSGANDRASWVFRYMRNRRPRTMGLGPYSMERDRPLVSLDEARERAWKLRRALKVEGVDPLKAREAEQVRTRLEETRARTFKECAEQYFGDHRASWKNKAHADQFPNSMKRYVFGLIGDLPVAEVDTDAVLSVLRQKVETDAGKVMFWHALPETASRVRQRIERVLQSAKVDGLREGENPARWAGHLEHRLPARSKLAAVMHHPALPYAEIGDFMAKVAKHDGTSARALELTILTATRTSEALKATWWEFDLEAKVWTIPAERMKAGREHRVPLSDAALAVLLKMRPAAPAGMDRKADPNAYIFPGQSRGKPLSNMSMLKLLERMGRTDLTVHGFRSTFRDWAAETEGARFPRDVVEMALAHTISSKVEAAYRRGDLLEPRRELMAAWATACATPRPASGIKSLEEAA